VYFLPMESYESSNQTDTHSSASTDYQWEAIPDESTGYWYFRNPWSGLYMALASDSDPVAQDSARAVGVPHPFAWDVVPERAYGAKGEACR
jgi:hypothetical protein